MVPLRYVVVLSAIYRRLFDTLSKAARHLKRKRQRRSMPMSICGRSGNGDDFIGLTIEMMSNQQLADLEPHPADVGLRVGKGFDGFFWVLSDLFLETAPFIDDQLVWSQFLVPVDGFRRYISYWFSSIWVCYLEHVNEDLNSKFELDSANPRAKRLYKALKDSFGYVWSRTFGNRIQSEVYSTQNWVRGRP